MPDLRGALEDIFQSDEFKAEFDAIEDDTAEEAEVEDDEEAADAPDAGAEDADAETETTDDESAEGDDATATDLPDEYFGVKRGNLSDEDWSRMVDELSKRDNYIQRLQQRRDAVPDKETPAAPAASDAPEPPAALSDEDIFRHFGYDPNDPMFEVTIQPLLPLLKRQYATEQRIDEEAEGRAIEAFAEHWMSTLNDLEIEYGKLPVPEGVSPEDARVGFVEWAASEGISDPRDAFFRVYAPANKAMREQVEKAREAVSAELTAKKKAAATGTRSRSSSKTGSKPLEGQNVRDAFAEAARQAAEEKGISWKDALDSAE